MRKEELYNLMTVSVTAQEQPQTGCSWDFYGALINICIIIFISIV